MQTEVKKIHLNRYQQRADEQRLRWYAIRELYFSPKSIKTLQQCLEKQYPEIRKEHLVAVIVSLEEHRLIEKGLNNIYQLRDLGKALYNDAITAPLLQIDVYRWIEEARLGGKTYKKKWVPTQIENPAIPATSKFEVRGKGINGEMAFLAIRTNRTLPQIYALLAEGKVARCPGCKEWYTSRHEVDDDDLCSVCRL